MEEKKFTIPVYSTDDGKSYVSVKHISENLKDEAIERNSNQNIDNVIPFPNCDTSQEDLEDYPMIKDILSKIKRNIIKDNTTIKEVIKKKGKVR